MADIDLGFVIGLPPEKAVEYLDRKGYRFSWDWQDTWEDAHARAFTAAKVGRMDILQDLRDGCRSALADGVPYKEVAKELTPKLKAKGWWGKKWVADETGAAKEVQLGSPQRVKLILEQNTRTALNAARWKQFEENKENRPYIMWVGIEDGKTCPICEPLIGTVHRIDDPLFESFFPGNVHFRDRCRARALNDRDIQRKGLTVQSSAGRLSEREITDPDGVVRKQAVYTHPDGTETSPAPGFSYNPAHAAWQPDLEKYDGDIARQYVEGAVTGPDFTRFFKGAVGGNFPVAVLEPDFQEAIGSKSQTVYLSGETMAKQLQHHPELALKEYQALPQIISGDAVAILQKGDQKLIFTKQAGRYYSAVLKSAPDGLFLVTFHRVSDISYYIDRLKRQGDVKVIKNDL